MASGIEIAGLALAVLPLFISAAEHYKDSAKPIRQVFKHNDFAIKYKEELTQHKALLTLYIKGVVGRTSIPAQTQEILVNEPMCEAWSLPEVAEKLSGELGEAYNPFLDAVIRICKALARQIKMDTGVSAKDDDILKQLQDLCLENKPLSPSSTDKVKLLERIKFSWNSARRAEILDEFKDCNRALEKLSVAAHHAKPYIRKQRSRRVHAAYEHREVMRRLFDILCNACKCSRTEARQVGLQLRICIDEGDNDRDSTFQMIVFLSQNAICELSARIARATAEPPPPKRARILTPLPTSNNAMGTPSQNMKVLDDICTEISQARACQSCLQLIVDKHEKVYCSATQPSPQQNLTETQKLLSLTEMMSNLELYNNKRWLHREKSILAIILAYSLLQLHDSPWSQSQWNSDSINFLYNDLIHKPQLSPAGYLELRRPYTRSQVMSNVPQPNNNMTPSPIRRNAHLHALGVVLLELYLNRSIQKDVIASGTGDYRATAQDLLEDHADDMSMTAEYLQAVRFCLAPAPNPSSGSFSFEDKGFRERYYSEVIAMLEENLTSRFEISENAWLRVE